MVRVFTQAVDITVTSPKMELLCIKPYANIPEFCKFHLKYSPESEGSRPMDLNTPITKFRGLTPAQISKLTDRAKTLTYGQLVALDRNQIAEEKLLNLTLQDVQSISACFADYDPAKVQGAGLAAATGDACCCCTCCPCCSCTAATVIQPLN
jgi:hypothetical protein